MARSSKKTQITIAVVVILGAMIGLLVQSISEAPKSRFLSISELQAAPANYSSHRVRLGGKVVEGSIAVSDSSVECTFVMEDTTGMTIPVHYKGDLIPDTFKDKCNVVIAGHYNDGVFKADEMMAKCPSKYEMDKAEASGQEYSHDS